MGRGASWGRRPARRRHERFTAMTDDASKGFFGEPVKGRIGVLIAEHFDQTEFKKFNEFFRSGGTRSCT
jgi:hypothetical protein